MLKYECKYTAEFFLLLVVVVVIMRLMGFIPISNLCLS